ncbi:unnamed protein product [Protopolystoma xenopodis]|uniref:Uncharacterized protein n=1 Tax=Protopolystoma xenopodis TaxID=117903 RepID=A0A448WTY2_9PLAT|nr:unnamed protein product [Protopolystoma xenopodis]
MDNGPRNANKCCSWTPIQDQFASSWRGREVMPIGVYASLNCGNAGRTKDQIGGRIVASASSPHRTCLHNAPHLPVARFTTR